MEHKHHKHLLAVRQHNEALLQAYRFWSPQYDIHFGYWHPGINPFDRQAMLAELNRQVFRRLDLPDEPGMCLLDAGCGTGATLRLIARSTRHIQLCGIGQAPTLLDLGRQLNQRQRLSSRIELIEADFEKMPFEEACFHGTICIESSCYATGADKALLLQEINRVLRPAGRVVIVDAFRLDEKPLPRPLRPLVNAIARHWAIDELPVLPKIEERLRLLGYHDIQTTDLTWRTLPSALHIPWVACRLFLASLGRNPVPGALPYAKALLASLGMGPCIGHVRYLMLSARKRG